MRVSSFIILLSIHCSFATAQQSSVNESFVITKSKKLVLPAADRKFFSHTGKTSTSEHIQPTIIRFDTLSKIPKADFQLDPLSPDIKIDKNQSRSLSEHVAWIGFGNRFHSTAGYQYINAIEQKRRVLFTASHRSLRNGPTGNDLSAQNDQSLGLKVMQPVNSWNISLRSQLYRTGFNYFGLADSLFLDEQALSLIAPATLWKTSNVIGVSNVSNDELSIKSHVIYQTTKQTENQFTSEHRLGLATELAGDVSSNLSWRFIPSFDYLVNSSSLGNKSRLVSQTPIAAIFKKSNWYLQGGLNWVNDQREADDGNANYFLPKLIFTYNLSRYQSFGVGLNSGINLNTAFVKSLDNLYMNYAFQDYRTEITRFDWFASYRQSFLSNYHLQFSINYLEIQNKSFFFNESFAPGPAENVSAEKYSLIYEGNPVGLFQMNLSSQGSLSSKFRYEFSVRTNNYFLDSLEAAYHMPTFESRLSLNFTPSDKLLISSQLRYESGIQFSVVQETGQIMNLSLSGDYQINEFLHSNIRLENMLNQSNSRYYLYPSSPFLISIGLKALF